MTAPIEHTERDPVVGIIDWLKKNQRVLIASAAIIVVAIAVIMYLRMANERRENFANTLLTSARTSAASGNVALAITDLSDLAANHRGTIAAEEAEIMLAQLRLSEGQAEAAVQSLQEYIANGPSDQFRAPAHGLLGAALEQTVNLEMSAAAYRDAADAAWYDFLKAQYLLDAGRVLTESGDTAEAIATFEQILDELPETDMVMEARLRLGELRKGDIRNR